MSKKGEGIDLSKYRGHFKYREDVRVSECTNGTFQVRNKNIGVNIDDLKDSIEVSGLIQPIGVARSEKSESSDLYKWEIVWGQRRHYAYESLGIEYIPAMVLDKIDGVDVILSAAEGKALSVVENLIRVDMQTKEIWNAIEDIYLTFAGKGISADARICAEKTGLPYGVVKDAIKVELVKQTQGGEKTYRYAQEKMIPKTKAIDIINICKKADAISVDEKKATQFIDYIAAQDNKLQNNTLAAAKQNPGGTVAQWKKAGLELEKTKLKKVSTEFTPRTIDALSLAADSEGLTPAEWILSTIEDRLSTQGYI
jgi:ParB/RepB/Spo0J family partition protein